MKQEMVVVENGGQMMDMTIDNMREMMVHDMLKLNGKDEWFSSKLIAEQSNKKHFTILRDLKIKAVDFAGGKEYWENVVNGGKTYFNFVQSNLNKIFKILVVDRDKTLMYHEFLDGLKYYFDDRGYVEEIEMNGYVANHLMMSYSNKKLWDWQMYTRSLYAQNTELLADKFLGWMPDSEIDLSNLTLAQRTEVTLGMVAEWAEDEGTKYYHKSPKKISDKKMKRISAAKKIPYKTVRGQKRSDSACTDNRRFNKGGQKGKRWLPLFDLDENKIYSYEETLERFGTNDQRMRLFLVEHNLIKRDDFLDSKIVATPYFIAHGWAIRTAEMVYHEDFEEDRKVKGVEFTAHGIRYLSKLFITKARNMKMTNNVGTEDIIEFVDTPFSDYCSRYKVSI